MHKNLTNYLAATAALDGVAATVGLAEQTPLYQTFRTGSLEPVAWVVSKASVLTSC